jgi:hypothetical protein
MLRSKACWFSLDAGSCHFNILLALLLLNLACVRHAKAKGLLVLFGCSVGSCHTCPCSKHVTYDGVVLMVLSKMMLLRVSCSVGSAAANMQDEAAAMQCADNCAAKPIIMLSLLCSPKKMLLVSGSCHFNILLVGRWSIFFVCRVAQFIMNGYGLLMPILACSGLCFIVQHFHISFCCIFNVVPAKCLERPGNYECHPPRLSNITYIGVNTIL